MVVRHAVAQLPVAAQFLEALVDPEEHPVRVVELLGDVQVADVGDERGPVLFAPDGRELPELAGLTEHGPLAGQQVGEVRLDDVNGRSATSATTSAFAKPLMRRAWKVRKKGSECSDTAARL